MILNSRKYFSFLFLFFFPLITSLGQVYYTLNGTNLPNPKADTIYLTKGIFNGYDAVFGTLLVKENRNKPNSRLIDIPIIKVSALNKTSKPPIFLLNGGPGISNLWEDNFPEFLLDSFDIIIVGYRGVDGKVKLDSREIKEFIYNTNNPLQGSNYKVFEELWKKQFKELGEYFDLSSYSITEVCNDIETVCRFLNIKKLNFYAFSYGSMITQHFNQLYPNYIVKNILISPRPKTQNNFNFSDTINIKNTFDSLLHHHFEFNNIEINNFYKTINSDIKKIYAIDNGKFYLAVLNSLYSLDKTINLLEILIELENGNITSVLKFQSQLDIYFDKLAFIDCILKRYSVSRREVQNFNPNSFLSNIIYYGNKFWNSAPELNNHEISNPQKLSQASFIIHGKNDFISSIKYNTEIINSSVLTKNIFIENSAHEDAIVNVKLYKNEVLKFLAE